MADTTPETKASLDLVEDAYQFNIKSLIEQHEKTMAQLSQLALLALTNAVNLQTRITNNGAETDNMVAKQALRHADANITSQLRMSGMADAAAGENEENTVADTAQMSNPPVIKP